MSVIDFEYAGPNYLAYDIANHFCEFAGIDNVDYNLYPRESVQREWLAYYLQESATLKGTCTYVFKLYWKSVLKRNGFVVSC